MTYLKVVSYCRVSSKEQGDGFSLEAQSLCISNYCSINNMEIVKEYSEIASGKEKGRPIFSNMIKFLNKDNSTSGKCSIIIVEKSDRLYRNLFDFNLIDELKKKGLEIHFIKENSISNKENHSSQKFMDGIKCLIAKQYIDNLSEETIKGMQTRSKNGLPHGKAPIGYLNVKLSNGKSGVHIDKPIAPIIKRMFEMCARGNSSITDIHQFSVSEGLAYGRSSIANLLKNIYYSGYFMQGGQCFKGSYESIITSELFQLTQQSLNKRNSAKSGRKKHDWLYQGIIKCADCGFTITAEIKKQKYIYYHCSNLKCSRKSVREEKLISQTSDFLQSSIIPSKIMQWIKGTEVSCYDEESSQLKISIGHLQREKTKYKKKKDKLFNILLEDKISDEEYDEKKNEFNSLELLIDSKIDEKQQLYRNLKVKSEACVDTYELRDVFVQGNQIFRKKLLGIIFEKLLLKNGNLCFICRKPYDLFFGVNKVA